MCPLLKYLLKSLKKAYYLDFTGEKTKAGEIKINNGGHFSIWN